MIWEHLAHTDFEALDRDIPVVLSIAAIEQHGPHLPLDVDCRIGWHMCEQLDVAMPASVLILPQIKVCCSQHHMDFSGTLTVSHTTFLAYVREILDAVLAHGFRNVILLNSHGGNQSIGRVIVEMSGSKFRSIGGSLAIASWWDVARPELKILNESGALGIGHACEFETSLMLAISPELVRTDLVSGMNYNHYSKWTDSGLIEGAPVLMYRSMHELSDGTGTVGDPSMASAEKGEEIIKIVVSKLAELLTDLRQLSS